MIELKKANVHRIVATEDEAKKLVSLGFAIVDDGKKEENSKSVEEMTHKELQKHCKEKGYENYSQLNKEELLIFLTEKEGE